MERGKFENKEVTFEDHIKREHSLWHYLFFIVYIKTKESTEFTGPESYVHDMINVRELFYLQTSPLFHMYKKCDWMCIYT